MCATVVSLVRIQIASSTKAYSLAEVSFIERGEGVYYFGLTLSKRLSAKHTRHHVGASAGGRSSGCFLGVGRSQRGEAWTASLDS